MVIKNIILGTVLLLVSGCAIIGVETIAPCERDLVPSVSNHPFIVYNLNDGSTCVFHLDYAEGKHSHSICHQDAYLELGFPVVSNPEQIVAILGEPDSKTKNTFRYYTQQRSWKGIALDCAVIIPLTIPLMVPQKKDGYLEIGFNKSRISSIREYGTIVWFYGIGIDMFATGDFGVYSRSKIGFWKILETANQSLDLTVKTPVDPVNVLRTAGQAERSVLINEI